MSRLWFLNYNYITLKFFFNMGPPNLFFVLGFILHKVTIFLSIQFNILSKHTDGATWKLIIQSPSFASPLLLFKWVHQILCDPTAVMRCMRCEYGSNFRYARFNFLVLLFCNRHVQKIKCLRRVLSHHPSELIHRKRELTHETTMPCLK